MRCISRSASDKQSISGGGVGVESGLGRQRVGVPSGSVFRVPHRTADRIQSWTARLCCIALFDTQPVHTSEVSPSVSLIISYFALDEISSLPKHLLVPSVNQVMRSCSTAPAIQLFPSKSKSYRRRPAEIPQNPSRFAVAFQNDFRFSTRNLG